MHVGAVGVENTHDTNVQIVGAVVVEHDRLRSTLSLIVAGAGSNGVHIAVILLYLLLNAVAPTSLGMDRRISINLGGTGMEKSATGVTSELEQVQDAKDTALESLDGVGLLR